MAKLGSSFDFLPAKNPVYKEGIRVPEEVSNKFDDPFTEIPIQLGEMPDHHSNYLKVESITIILYRHCRKKWIIKITEITWQNINTMY